MVDGMLPDVLRYDPSRPAGYPNGRLLSDDALDLVISMVTHGAVPGDGVGPHDDYLVEFPFLGPPHPST